MTGRKVELWGVCLELNCMSACLQLKGARPWSVVKYKDKDKDKDKGTSETVVDHIHGQNNISSPRIHLDLLLTNDLHAQTQAQAQT